MTFNRKYTKGETNIAALILSSFHAFPVQIPIDFNGFLKLEFYVSVAQ